VACTRFPCGSAAVLWCYAHLQTFPQPAGSSPHASEHAAEYPKALTMYTRMHVFTCAWLWRALGSRAARLLFYSATRIYRPLPSLLDRCRKRQGTPLSFRTRPWGTHVCACVCARGYSVHSVPEWLSCCSVVLHASTDLSPARGIAAVSVDALARLDWGRPRGWLPRRPSSRPTTASRTAAAACLSLSTSLSTQSGRDAVLFSGISARKGCLSVATEAGVPKAIPYLQSGHGPAMPALAYMHLHTPARLVETFEAFDLCLA
jgi:hypothetical protein